MEKFRCVYERWERRELSQSTKSLRSSPLRGTQEPMGRRLSGGNQLRRQR